MPRIVGYDSEWLEAGFFPIGDDGKVRNPLSAQFRPKGARSADRVSPRSVASLFRFALPGREIRQSRVRTAYGKGGVRVQKRENAAQRAARQRREIEARKRRSKRRY